MPRNETISDMIARTDDEQRRLVQRKADAPIKAPRPQDLDTSPLPLFGDGHKQMKLF